MRTLKKRKKNRQFEAKKKKKNRKAFYRFYFCEEMKEHFLPTICSPCISLSLSQ